MKIKDQVVSLELAREMKELGAEQDSVWYWIRGKIRCWITSSDSDFRLYDAISLNVISSLYKGKKSQFKEKYSAYTVAELGEMLPYASFSMRLNSTNKNPPWFCDAGLLYPRSYANKEADARAKMLIWLIKERIIKVDEIG